MRLRAVLAMAATLALLIGASLPASAAPVVTASSAGTKTVGFTTYFWGTVTESGEQDVWTEVQLGDVWSRSQTGRTDSSGGYVLELTYGFTTAGDYRFRVGARTSAGVVYSEPFTLTRTPWQPSWAGTKPVGETTYVWGTMPRAANRSVWTEALVGGRWSRSQVRTANASGYFAIPLTYGSNTVGEYTFRVVASTTRGTVYSQPFVLRRTATVVAYSAGTKPVNQVTYTWGTVRGYGGGQVWTQVLLSSGWSTSQIRTADANGAFIIPLTYGASTPGTYTFRVGASTPFGTVYSNQFTLLRTASNLVETWRGEDIEVFPVSRKVVALTFDGGADNAGVGSILATLKANGVPATFFVTGDFARSFPSDVRAMAQAGHPVGNHSNTHPYFTQISDAAIRQELSLADAAISPLSGRPTAPLFRFPYGDRTSADIQVVNDAGYVPIRWTVDTLGWQGTSEGITTAIVRQRVLDAVRPGAIVLMHVGAHPRDGSTLDADALQGMIDDLRARGYAFATVSSLLAE
jgi:peptidoglycan/xylan/chitin deacetylase (PgdA/CDA1 family)